MAVASAAGSYGSGAWRTTGAGGGPPVPADPGRAVLRPCPLAGRPGSAGWRRWSVPRSWRGKPAKQRVAVSIAELVSTRPSQEYGGGMTDSPRERVKLSESRKPSGDDNPGKGQSDEWQIPPSTAAYPGRRNHPASHSRP